VLRNRINQLLRANRKITIALLVCLLAIIVWFIDMRMNRELVLDVEHVTMTSFADVVPVTDSLVKPVLYDSIVSLRDLEGGSLKQTFINIVLPAILIARHKIKRRKEQLIQLRDKKDWKPEDSTFYKQWATAYEADSLSELIMKHHTHPSSIVLAQAAVESGWGTSRFFRVANNLFGIWSFDPDEPRIKASSGRGERAIYLRKYENLTHSIEDYFDVLARSYAYEKFRQARAKDISSLELVNHLIYYSERRWAYVRQIKTIMQQNNLMQYDSCTIDPQYFVYRSKRD